MKNYLSGDSPFLAISYHRLKSPMILKAGYVNVAGLFNSKKKWPTQAKPYPMVRHNTGGLLIIGKVQILVINQVCVRMYVCMYVSIYVLLKHEKIDFMYVCM